MNNLDIGETSRIVNMLLLLLDEYNAKGILLATTNLEDALDPAIYRRFDSIIEMPKPGVSEIEKILRMTLSNIPSSEKINWIKLSDSLADYSYSNVVKIATTAAKNSILDDKKTLSQSYIEQAIKEFKVFH
jgi:SpoVK/Ycf46/Vps4 family AAA+-type ATPase